MINGPNLRQSEVYSLISGPNMRQFEVYEQPFTRVSEEYELVNGPNIQIDRSQYERWRKVRTWG